MSKTFVYTRQCGPSYYSEQTDEEFCDEESFEYEVSLDEIQEGLAEIIADSYFKDARVEGNYYDIVKAIKSFISDNDLEDGLIETYEDELKDHFEDDAFNSLDD